MSHTPIIAVVVLACLAADLAACASGEAERVSDAGADAVAADAAAATAPPWAATCVAPAGTTAAPQSIADVVGVLNAMPKPVSLACFLATLPRPLELHATRSVTSAQPAVGRRSPRIFIFLDGMILSVVPAGVGARLLEFGESRADDRSLKAEIEFPVTDALTPAAPFDRIMYDDQITSCAFCHAAETAADDITFTRAFVSRALRPSPTDQVSVAELKAELTACDATAEAERCAMLQSLFARDPPLEREFPASFALFR